MNQKIEWWSQPFRAEGDHTGDGIKNQLGRPKLGEFEILIRESVQNSWDARKKENDRIAVTFTLRQLGPTLGDWVEWLSDSSVPGVDEDLLEQITSESALLIVSDRNTVGLGGPIRSDQIVKDGQLANFVQFIRNVGEPRDQKLGGGTYGFGKGIFYRVSAISTILVDSQNLEKGPYQRRLMGASLTSTFHDQEGKRFTGRHWWGEINDGIPDPVVGPQAARISESLGLPGFKPTESGTDIVILLPQISLEDPNETLESLGERLRSHIYWNLWPKFETISRPHGIDFAVVVGDQPLEMPTIDEIPVLKDFARSLDNIAKHKGSNYEMKKYKQHLGEFSTEFVINVKTPGSNPIIDSIFEWASVRGPYSHIARMRQAELVVDYVRNAPMLSTQVGYVGVFRATPYSDQYFALSEPPTHDDWSVSGLTGSALGIVRGANTFINDQCTNLVHAKSGARSKIVQGLGKLSNTLGTFVQNAEGSRALSSGRKKRTSVSGQSVSRKGFRQIGKSKVVIIDEKPAVELSIAFDESPAEGLRLEAEAFIVLANGGRELPGDGLGGTPQPTFLGWFNELGYLISTDSQVSAEQLTAGLWAVRFSHLENVALQINVRETFV